MHELQCLTKNKHTPKLPVMVRPRMHNVVQKFVENSQNSVLKYGVAEIMKNVISGFSDDFMFSFCEKKVPFITRV